MAPPPYGPLAHDIIRLLRREQNQMEPPVLPLQWEKSGQGANENRVVLAINGEAALEEEVTAVQTGLGASGGGRRSLTP